MTISLSSLPPIFSSESSPIETQTMETFPSILRSNSKDFDSGITPQQADFLKSLSDSKIKGIIREKGGIRYYFDTIPWNIRCWPKPLAVVYPIDPREVSTVVKIAAQYGIPVQPRSGGHSFGSYSLGGKDGALVIDLEKMSSVVVDQKTWKATIGGGTKLKEVTNELYNQGKRTIAHGICPQVGIGGHTTVGGLGPLSRQYGLTLDHVVDMEVVLADGSIVSANETTNSDLFFAMRGAGASMGIATSFTFETHSAPDVVTHYSFHFKCGSSDELVKFFLDWQDFILSPVVMNDRKFNCVTSITRDIILIQGTRFGEIDEFKASETYIALKNKFKVDITTHVRDWLGGILYWATNAVEVFSGTVSIPLYAKSLSVKQSKPLTRKAVGAWFDYMHKHSPSDCIWVVLADLQGGRISDIPRDATAYASRDNLYALCAYSIGSPWHFPDDALGFLNGMVETLEDEMPDANFGVYPGYVDPLLPKTKWPKLYWGDNYPRLVEIKKKYDPNNTFSNPQSVGSDGGL